MPAEPRETTRLEAINASGITITNNGLEHLVGLEGVYHLDFTNCKYLSDEGLVHLANVRGSLLELELSGCPSISSSGLPCLYGLSRLQYLGLRDTPGIRDRDTALAALLGALPHCQIGS
ncbi:ATP synthase subunit s, mitochondrial [Geodia barretti]|nr:ATP synthase subunit s, mitochondrial [Geodia barretti]